MFLLVVLISAVAVGGPVPDWVGAQTFDERGQCEAAGHDLASRDGANGVLLVQSYCVEPGRLLPVNPQLTKPAP